MKKILAVYDEDRVYAERLTDYLNQKKFFPFSVIQFTRADTLLAYAREHRIAVLLISPGSMEEKLRQLDVATIVYLTDAEGVNCLDSCRAVYKYQSAENVVRELSACYDAMIPPEPEKQVLRGTGQILGVYAPYGGSGKTTFALLLSMILAERYRVLFLTMEGFAGFSGMFGREFDYDLSDALFYSGKDVWKEKKDAFVQEYRGMRWIPPVCYPEDREYLTEENIQILLNSYLDSGEYDRIILDIADHFFFSPAVLPFCQKIYIPVRKDPMAGWKLKEMDAWMEQSGRKALRERLRRVELPSMAVPSERGQYLEALMYSEAADYVRALVAGEADGKLEG